MIARGRATLHFTESTHERACLATSLWGTWQFFPHFVLCLWICAVFVCCFCSGHPLLTCVCSLYAGEYYVALYSSAVAVRFVWISLRWILVAFHVRIFCFSAEKLPCLSSAYLLCWVPCCFCGGKEAFAGGLLRDQLLNIPKSFKGAWNLCSPDSPIVVLQKFWRSCFRASTVQSLHLCALRLVLEYIFHCPNS